MRNRDLILVAQKCGVITAFPQHHWSPEPVIAPSAQSSDRCAAGIAASLLDGLLYMAMP
jgi:ethanolamine ammonia-lyase large subunit